MTKHFLNHLKYASRLTKSWPTWKQQAAGLTKHDNWHRYPVGQPQTVHKCCQTCLCHHLTENDNLNPDCPIHGNTTTRPHCSRCGKFLPRKPSNQSL